MTKAKLDFAKSTTANGTNEVSITNLSNEWTAKRTVINEWQKENESPVSARHSVERKRVENTPGPTSYMFIHR